MMNTEILTPNAGLVLTPDDPGTLGFKAWRKRIDGEENSNMQKIDAKLGELDVLKAEAARRPPLENAFELGGKWYTGLFLGWDGADYVFSPGEGGDYFLYSDGFGAFIRPIGVMLDAVTGKRYKNAVRNGEYILKEA
jgi:hypothetical protein